MVQFLDNTIYTDYALNKICENLVEEISNFNFIKVKVGSGDNTLSEERTDLSTLLYSLIIQDIQFDQTQGVLTIMCELPPELAEVPITEIGLFDTVMGFDHLFSYSKVNIVKPADIGYELTIVLNLGPRTIDFPGINEFIIPEDQYATAESLNKFTDMFIYVTTNLERAVRSNAEEVGRNMAEVSYQRGREWLNYLLNSNYANLYYSLLTTFSKDLSDTFFIYEPNFLSYNICNLQDDKSFLETYNKLWKSNKDNITLHNGPMTLMFMAKFEDLNKESTIINKKGDVDLYFSFDIKQNSEPYLLYNGPEDEPTYQEAIFNELVITFYSLSDVYEIRYVFDMSNMGLYTNQSMPYALSFNGDFANPDIHFYFNGKEPELYNKPTEIESSLDELAGIEESDSDEEKASKRAKKEEELKTRLYGKLIINSEKSVLADMPDWSYLPIKNYLTNYETGKIDKYENALGITELIMLKRQVSKNELALLSNSLITLEENKLNFL